MLCVQQEVVYTYEQQFDTSDTADFTRPNSKQQRTMCAHVAFALCAFDPRQLLPRLVQLAVDKSNFSFLAFRCVVVSAMVTSWTRPSLGTVSFC